LDFINARCNPNGGVRDYSVGRLGGPKQTMEYKLIISRYETK
jgi:hypothetical protein